jgi:hypothetical protein
MPTVDPTHPILSADLLAAVVGAAELWPALLAPADVPPLLLQPANNRASVTPIETAPLATRNLFAALTEFPLVVCGATSMPLRRTYVVSIGRVRAVRDRPLHR